MSKRDKQIEAFLMQAMTEAEGVLQQQQQQQPKHDERPSSKKRRILNFAQEKLMQESMLLAHRYNPILKEHLAAEEQFKVAEGYAKVTLPTSDVADMALMYQNAVNTWLDSNDKVSFATTNTIMAGQLQLKDCWILHYFAFLCCYRCEGDNLFSLAVTGCSTTRKTVLFENPIMANSHSFVGESGVSRYRVGNKSLLLYSDIALERFMKGSDCEKFKTISRSEKTVCKIHSSTEELPPVFVFLTSNQNIHRHVFGKVQVSDKEKLAPLFFKSKSHPSTLDLMYTQPAKIKMMAPLVSAIKNWVLEAFVSGQTKEKLVLPTTSKFERIHAILGLYRRILNLLLHYEPVHFYSSALVTYVLTGLIDHASLWQSTMLQQSNSNKQATTTATATATSATATATSATATSISTQLEHVIDKYFGADKILEKNVFLKRLTERT